MRYLLGGKVYDAYLLCRLVREEGAAPVVPGCRNRKHDIHYDKQRYRARYLAEHALCRLRGFRRVHAGYDKLAVSFFPAVALVIAAAFWL